MQLEEMRLLMEQKLEADKLLLRGCRFVVCRVWMGGSRGAQARA